MCYMCSYNVQSLTINFLSSYNSVDVPFCDRDTGDITKLVIKLTFTFDTNLWKIIEKK